MHTELEGRVVAVAGAGGNLGPPTCEALAGGGATVAATDVEAKALEAVARRVGAAPERWQASTVDLLDPEATVAWAEELRERFGRVDALVHLVGGWRGGEAIDTAPPEDYEWLHDALVRTLQHTTRAFLPALRETGGRGRLVVVSSAAAQRPSATGAPYAAAKAAAEAWTLAAADDLSATGGTANIVVVREIGPERGSVQASEASPTATPADDLARAVAWMLGDGAAAMNGQRLALHG